MKPTRVALIQFDARPEAPRENLERMRDWVRAATEHGARWIMFHEGTLCDYTPRLGEFAERVPSGASSQSLIQLARERDCFISFGLSEVDGDKYYISQVFAGPGGLIHCYRKTWLWRNETDTNYRNEWARYDPGEGPSIFEVDGLAATCFICADGDAPRCIERAAQLQPQVAFYPNNRSMLPGFEVFACLARKIRAPLLVTNRTGDSWGEDCRGGCVVYSATGEVLAKANRDGREEMLLCDLPLFSQESR